MLELAALWDRAAADEGCERRGSGDNGAIFSGHQAKDDTARRRGGPSGVGRVAAGASAFVCSCSRASPLSFACAQPPRPGGACLAWPGRALHLPHSRAAHPPAVRTTTHIITVHLASAPVPSPARQPSRRPPPRTPGRPPPPPVVRRLLLLFRSSFRSRHGHSLPDLHLPREPVRFRFHVNCPHRLRHASSCCTLAVCSSLFCKLRPLSDRIRILRQGRKLSVAMALTGWTKDLTGYFLFILFTATLGPLLFGFHLAELNAPEDVIRCKKKSINASASSTLPQCMPLDPAQWGLVSSIFTLGGLIGALSAGPVASRYGRLRCMHLTTIFFVIGPVFEALSPNTGVLALGRFLSGVGAGAAVVVVPIYISEIAPPAERGFFGAFTQIMCNVGILLTQLLGYFLSHDSMWRIILAVGGVVGLVQAIGLVLGVESPKWSADQGHPSAAKKNLRKIRGSDANISEEISDWGVENVDQMSGRLSLPRFVDALH